MIGKKIITREPIYRFSTGEHGGYGKVKLLDKWK